MKKYIIHLKSRLKGATLSIIQPLPRGEGYGVGFIKTLIPNKYKQSKIYTIVLKAFLNGLNYDFQPNTTGFDIDKKVREIIEKNKPEEFNFLHGTGHGIGVSVHEFPPSISPAEAAKTELKAGMCFTIEPGIYCDEWGGVRIENSVTVIQENAKLKIKTLTKSNFDYNLIDYNILSSQEKIWLEIYKKQAMG